MSNIRTDEQGVLMACPQCGQRNRLRYERLGETGRCGKCRAELRAPAEPIDVSNAADFDALTSRSALPVLVDFWAPWCGPARWSRRHSFRSLRKARSLDCAKVNTEEAPNLGSRFRISVDPDDGGVSQRWC
jgi:thioredoxin 2